MLTNQTISFIKLSGSVFLSAVRGRFCVSLMFLLGFGYYVQGQIVVPNYTGCPNQIVSVTLQWPNTSITSLSLDIPGGGGSATNNGNLQTSTSFTISHPGPGNTSWTITGTGMSNGNPVSSTVIFQLTVIPPAPLTFTNQVVYCPGDNAQITTNPGGNSYVVTGAQNLGSFQTNVIIIPNLTVAHTGTYLVTSVGSCTTSGITTIQVAPPQPLTVNGTSNVCEGPGQVSLQAGMPGGANWQWYDPQQNTISSGFANHVIQPIASNIGGVYTVYVDQIFFAATGSVSCPRTATTQVNVVQTNPVSVSASPSGVLCQNDKLSLNANAGASSYVWEGPCNFGPVTIQSPTISPVVPCNSGDYTVTAYFTNSFTTCPMTNTINVDVIATVPPVANVPNTVCQGEKNVLLTATGCTNNCSWIWYGPNFSAFTKNTQLAVAQPGNSGPYVVTSVFTHNGSSKTCSVSSLPQQLTVIPINSISVIPPKPVCMPENAHLSSSAPGADSYEWKGPNNITYYGANVTVYYPTPTVSGIYTVTAYFGSLKCPSTETVELTVNPVLNFSLVPRQQACYNTPVKITGPAGADSYSWTSSTGKTGSSRDLYFPSILPEDAGTYTLNISLGPCITKAASAIEVLTPISFTLKPQNRTVCQGDTVPLQAGVTGGSQNYAYTWNPALYMNSPTGPNKTLVPQATVQYNLMVYDIACPSFTLGHNVEVNVKHAPKPSLRFDNIRGCAPFSQVYINDSAAEAAITTIDFGGLLQYQSDSLRVTLTEPGAYTLKVISRGTNSCTGVYQYPHPIIVEPSPGSDFNWSPTPANTTEEITFHPTSRYEPITYRSWHFSGGAPAVIDTNFYDGLADTTNEASPVRRYERFGKYPVMLISENDRGCIDTVVKFIDVIDEMRVYIPDAFTPNGDGVNDRFAVKGQGMDMEAFTMEIFNRRGQSVFSTRDLNDSWDGMYEGRPCPDGIYTYKIRIVGMNGDGRKEFLGRIALIK